MKRFMFTIGAVVACALIIFSGTAFAQQEKTDKHRSDDSTIYNMGGMKVMKVGEDSIMVSFKHHNHGSHNDHGSCPFSFRKDKYNGHWAGFDLGWNGYVNSDFTMSLPDKYKFLDLNTARSMMVNINPIELNLNLVNNHFGLTSGLGFQIDNFFFTDKNYYFVSDSAYIIAFRMYDGLGNPIAMTQSKMVVSWLTVPILFEYQTNAKMKSNSFHIGAGVVGGIRIGQYTKQYYPGINQTYYLKDDNGNLVGTFSSSHYKTHDHSQYHLNPFMLEGTVRVGWSFLNFFTTYSIFPMFQTNQGPELYTWTAGISLIGW
jgi:hypothetical protein